MSLITCKVSPPTSWENWCAQPGTDVFGHPWSSWKHGGPACNCAAGECKFGRARVETLPVPAPKVSPQMELAL